MAISSTVAAIHRIDQPCTPATLFRAISSREVHLLDELAYLCSLRAISSRRRAFYATPGRKWLAARLGVSISTISRYTSHLKALGVLRKTQRRPREGHYQTNLYSLCGKATFLLAKTVQQLHRRPIRVAQTQHIAPSEGRVGGSAEARSALRAIIQKLEEKIRGG